MSVELGDLVKDRITGFTGIVVAKTLWLSNCDRLTVQPRELNKDGEMVKSITFDVTDLLVLEKNAIAEKPEATKTGGPMPEPKRESRT